MADDIVFDNYPFLGAYKNAAISDSCYPATVFQKKCLGTLISFDHLPLFIISTYDYNYSRIQYSNRAHLRRFRDTKNQSGQTIQLWQTQIRNQFFYQVPFNMGQQKSYHPFRSNEKVKLSNEIGWPSFPLKKIYRYNKQVKQTDQETQKIKIKQHKKEKERFQNNFLEIVNLNKIELGKGKKKKRKQMNE